MGLVLLFIFGPVVLAVAAKLLGADANSGPASPPRRRRSVSGGRGYYGADTPEHHDHGDHCDGWGD